MYVWYLEGKCWGQRWDNSDSGIRIGIGIDPFSSWMESELNQLLGIEDIVLSWNRNRNLTAVSGIGIGIEGAGICYYVQVEFCLEKYVPPALYGRPNVNPIRAM